MYRGRKLLIWGILIAAILTMPAVGVGDTPQAEAAPSPTEQGAGLETAAASVRTIIVSDHEINRVLGWRMLGASVHFLPGNQVQCGWLSYNDIFNIGVQGGKGYVAPASAKLGSMLWMLSGFSTMYSSFDSRVYLTRLPFWVNPRLFAPDVTRLPTILSVTTSNGRAMVTYRWP